jgi:uncharacterized tellurite resistance protein B-like protein
MVPGTAVALFMRVLHAGAAAVKWVEAAQARVPASFVPFVLPPLLPHAAVPAIAASAARRAANGLVIGRGYPGRPGGRALDSDRGQREKGAMALTDRMPLVADLLMDAAHADDHLHGEEKAAVRRLLCGLLDAPALPMDLDFHIQEFDRARFDLAAAAGAFAADPPALKRRLLELCAAVHAADGEFDFAEDEQLRRVAAALGLAEEDYADLVVTVVDEIDLGDDLERLRYGESQEEER